MCKVFSIFVADQGKFNLVKFALDFSVLIKKGSWVVGQGYFFFFLDLVLKEYSYDIGREYVRRNKLLGFDFRWIV